MNCMEKLLLTGVAVVMAGGILVAIAATPAYALAYGIVLVALFFVLLQDSGYINQAVTFMGKYL